MTDAASWKAVERKARLAGNGLSPCPEAQHRGQPLSGSPEGSVRHYYLDRVLGTTTLGEITQPHDLNSMK